MPLAQKVAQCEQKIKELMVQKQQLGGRPAASQSQRSQLAGSIGSQRSAGSGLYGARKPSIYNNSDAGPADDDDENSSDDDLFKRNKRGRRWKDWTDML